ncbi:hypothetical protein [Amycolatopsis kentuckyensis]|nr:hypothetical protein [Amycolatopsis kentuckyensis]
MGEDTAIASFDEQLDALLEEKQELKVEEIAVAPRSKMRVNCE